MKPGRHDSAQLDGEIEYMYLDTYKEKPIGVPILLFLFYCSTKHKESNLVGNRP